MRVAACVSIAAMLAACPAPAPDGCVDDRDCVGAVCTRVGVCSADPYALRIGWTIAGAAADPTTCEAAVIGELEVAIEDPSFGDRHAVRPVPCATGSFFFDKLPPSYRLARVTAFSPAGQFVATGAADVAAGTGQVTIDLRPR